MKNIKLLLILFACNVTFAQVTKNTKLKEISGFVTNTEGVFKKVNITIKGTKKGTISDKNGYYKINAKEGDFLQFSYVGFNTSYVIVEDVTKRVHVTLKSSDNVLDEIVIENKKNRKKQKYLYRMGRGIIDVRSVNYISGDKLDPIAISIANALRGKISGLRVYGNRVGYETVTIRGRAPIWDVDGMIYTTPPPLNIEQVKSIAVIKSLSKANAYGFQGAGGVIIVNTFLDDYQKKLINDKDVYSKNNPYTNKNYYNNDAINSKNLIVGKPEYLDLLNDKNNAFKKYLEISETYNTISNFYFNIINHFDKKLNDKKSALKVLTDFENHPNTNVEDLKVIAYKYQEFNETTKALEIYKQIATLRPTHVQSYRDLANGYIELNDYRSAWNIYKYYLNKGFKIEQNDIGDILNSEMLQTFINRKKDPNFKENLNINDPKKIIESDVRIVFEWDTSDAEFAFEFVSPNKQVYSKGNSFEADNTLIIDQKSKGYSSKEFMIEELGKGDWLVNYTYFGNKKYKPTFLKVTTYYNWGKSNQRKEINLHELSLKNVKSELLKINQS